MAKLVNILRSDRPVNLTPRQMPLIIDDNLTICKLIVWDECTMAHKRSPEALDRTLKDLRDNQNIFGGVLILLSGDFRQTLPVIPRSIVAAELNACLKSSNLWRLVKTLRLTTNMRVFFQQDRNADVFSKQLLDIGNVKIAVDISTGFITLLTDFCQLTESKEELIWRVFPNIAQNSKNHNWLSERAILPAKNKDVNDLNAIIRNFIPGQLFSFKSVDTVINQDEVVNYPTEFLNSLELPGLPHHNLQLKVGSVIIMLRNINQPRLCNGTRLAVKQLMNNVIEATTIKGKYKGEDVLIPRIPMIPTDLPFDFKRLQFPVRLAFAMAINKSQGQSMEVCRINLEFPCFAHGQLYVACSRDRKPSSLFIYAPENKTKKMIMDLNNLGAVYDSPLVRGKQIEEFTRKLDMLTKDEIKASFEVTCKDMLAILGQAVPCVGCRRSVERLFYDLMKSAHPALDPLVITNNGLLTIKDEILDSPQLLCTMLQGHSARLNSLVERQPRSKKSRRCALHSLEVQRMRPSSGAWREVWDCMKPACRQEVTLVENESLEATLDTYLRKHRFCGECRTKVLLASSLLTTEPEPAKEKGYVPALYAGIKRCIPERHLHLPTNTDYISAIIERAQPELMGRERHAKTLEIAQEEVLTCLGICVSERLHRVHRRLREEETVCRVLAAVAVDALSRNFQMAVEVKQGITQLELLYEELTREEMAKQQRREKLRLKRKKKKERRYETEEKENTCQCLRETKKDITQGQCVICGDTDQTNKNTTDRHELKTSDTTKEDLGNCDCPDCTTAPTEIVRAQTQTETSFPRQKKASDASVTDKKSRESAENDSSGGAHRNLEIINNSMKSMSILDMSFEPCQECKDLFEKRGGKWMIREEFEEPSDKEIMDAWLGRPSKRFSMWMETKKRYDDVNKIPAIASNRRDSSAQSSQDCGYSSEHNISSSSLPSTPEGSELACSESCCNQDDGECHDSNFHHNVVYSNSNIFLFREQTTGKVSHGLTLTQMLEEGYSSEDEGNEESYIPAEEVKEFQSRMCQVIEKRQELRQTLRKRFAILCSHRKPIPRH